MSTLRRVINSYENFLAISLSDETNVIDHVPAMVYTVDIDDNGRLLLRKDRPEFNLPQLIFGDHNKYFNRIISDYSVDGNMVGVMLVGDPGTGKSLLGEALGNWCIKQDVPVIMIDKPLGPEILSTIVKVIGPCMFYFDEFEKVFHYNPDEDPNSGAGALLSFFSNTALKGVLSVMTVNNTRQLPYPLLNRPQRIKYLINYDPRIPLKTVEEVLSRMKVHENLHDCYRIWAGHGRNVNMDALLQVVRMTAGMDDPKEFEEYLSIINVPSFPTLSWTIESISVVRGLTNDEVIAMNVSIDNGTTIKLSPICDRGANRPVSETPITKTLTESGVKHREVLAVEGGLVEVRLVAAYSMHAGGYIRTIEIKEGTMNHDKNEDITIQWRPATELKENIGVIADVPYINNVRY